MILRLDDAALVPLNSFKDTMRGALCVVEYEKDIPFEIKRIFYLYDLPIGGVRGQHAHRKQAQFLICLSGSIELYTFNKHSNQHFILSQPNEGIYFPPMTWIDIKVLENPAICLVISSGLYDEDDYIRNFPAFKALLNNEA